MTLKEICYHIIELIINLCSLGKTENNSFPPHSINLEDILKIVEYTKNQFDNEPSVLKIETKNKDLIIVGDIHGDIDTLVRIFGTLGYPPNTQYLFLGDYIDRGENSCEVIIFLYAYKCLYPNDIYLIRGNHEFKDMAVNYGFQNECLHRVRGDSGISDGYNFFSKVTDTFSSLPICAIINNTTFCVHGGISALIDRRDQLLSLKKVGMEYCSDDSVQVEFLWNDPDSEIDYPYKKSPRGIGCLFNQEALAMFLKSMGFTQVIRGHQVAEKGFQFAFGRKGGILTLFSSVNYCGTFNDAGVMKFKKNIDSQDSEEQEIVPFRPKQRKDVRFLIPEEILMEQKSVFPLENVPQLIVC